MYSACKAIIYNTDIQHFVACKSPNRIVAIDD